MDSMCFEMKLAHWRGVGITNFLLRRREVPMTAARVQLMHTIVMFSPSKGPVQVTLRQLLGCAASTVSRMLKALEEMGFVKRVRVAEDRRYKRVTVTEEGMAVLKDAAAYTMHDENVKHRVDLATAEAHLGSKQAARRRAALSAGLTRWRWVMGDYGMKPDPWTRLREAGAEDPLAKPRPPRERPSGPDVDDPPPRLPKDAGVHGGEGEGEATQEGRRPDAER